MKLKNDLIKNENDYCIQLACLTAKPSKHFLFRGTVLHDFKIIFNILYFVKMFAISF